jgi:site-specific DNA-methyltransferase (adenine-specific)
MTTPPSRPAPWLSDGTVALYLGKAETVLPALIDASVDAVCTDPPYELGFMGKSWDAAGVAYDVSMWEECLRVLKPGGHLLAFGGPRTYHRMVCAVEDAGFEIRNSIHWIYGSGFPKSLDVSKAIDQAGGSSPAEQAAVLRAARQRAGLTRDQVADAVGCSTSSVRNWEEGRARAKGLPVEHIVPSPSYRARLADVLGYSADERVVTGMRIDRRGDGTVIGLGHSGAAYGDAVTPLATQWAGWGTGLKPSHEPITLARKPLNGTCSANVAEHGTGALNIDGCRVAVAEDDDIYAKHPHTKGGFGHAGAQVYGASKGAPDYDPAQGRWPPNAVFSHLPGCGPDDTTPCAEGCAVAELDRQSGHLKSGLYEPHHQRNVPRLGHGGTYGDDEGAQRITPTYGDEGAASRFFPVFRYQAKATAAERPRVDGVAHETVKPLDLLRWLVRLVTPPGGVVLDPFLGSGTTAEACVIEGFRCVGIEYDERYIPLIKARLSKPLQPTLGFGFDEGIG